MRTARLVRMLAVLQASYAITNNWNAHWHSLVRVPVQHSRELSHRISQLRIATDVRSSCSRELAWSGSSWLTRGTARVTRET